MRVATCLLSCMVLLAACTSPPKPPSVDASERRPVNSPVAVELQVCKNDLQNTRIQAVESARLAQSASAMAAHAAARQQASVGLTCGVQGSLGGAQPNKVFTTRFAPNSSQVAISSAITGALLAQAKSAALVVLRARVERLNDTAQERRLAHDRAVALRDYLSAGGVSPARVRITYQLARDPVGDASSPPRRAAAGRVEIELYSATPVTLTATAGEQP